MDKQIRPFGMRDKIGYMFGDFGNDFTFILSSAFMLKFYTDVMGIGAGVVGMLMMAARFLDAFTDITMGQIVDRSKPGKDGKFRPWIRRMCGPVAISSFLIYQSAFAGMPYWFKVGWMVVWFDGFGNFCRGKGPCAALNLADGRSNSCRARNWSRNTDACLCYGGRSDGFVGISYDGNCRWIFCSILFVLSAVCKTHGRACRGAGE